MDLGGLKMWLGITSKTNWGAHAKKWLENSGCLYWFVDRLAITPKQHWWWVWWLVDCDFSIVVSAFVWQSCWTKCWTWASPEGSYDADILPAWMRLAKRLRQRAIQSFLMLFILCLFNDFVVSNEAQQVGYCASCSPGAESTRAENA